MCHELERTGQKEARTTCAIVWFDEKQTVTAHIGDTRIYRLNKEGDIWHTKDHSMTQQWVDEGTVDNVDVVTIPERHILLESIGISKKPKPTIFILKPLEQNDTVVLCTDGFWEQMKKGIFLC